MSESAMRLWRGIERGAGPYAERADERESWLERWLLATVGELRRPFSGLLAEARRVADAVENHQARVDGLSDRQLREEADALRVAILREGLAPELVARAFALVRTAAQRTIGLRHYPVQMLGGYAMLRGRLAEMETGEGKTLTATLPAATMALAGVPVHVVTVNDYLAARDARWMEPVYAALGISVGVVTHEHPPEERRQGYAADITYCTNKDLGFDYLRDRLALATEAGRDRLLVERLGGGHSRLDDLLLRGLFFAIVDEADSVLIDEARTPLIISGGGGDEGEQAIYETALGIARDLVLGKDFELVVAERTVRFTDAGLTHVASKAERFSGAWRSRRGREELVEQALSALYLFTRDTHYIVREGKVQIVDEFTGRVLADRRWERGLQQLIEVKEGCKASGRRETLARVTYQRLFRRYLRLAGMTGTAFEVAPELEAVYGLQVLRIPTSKPVQRLDCGARLYRTTAEKWAAVAATARELCAAGRPVLVGTRSVAASEALSACCAAEGIAHVVLNARQDEDEAQKVEQAGAPGRVTVATNMAGRGTDIRISAEVEARGGLHVILTEYHETARIDRQLYGRGGRQGNRGSYEAIVSLEDEIFRRHASVAVGWFGRQAVAHGEPMAAWRAATLRRLAQRHAERVNARSRRATLEQDKQLDTALSFAGRGE